MDASSNETISIYSPHDESLVVEGIQVASPSDVDKAVDAAKAAFEGEWSTWTPSQRSEVMLRFAALADKHAEEFAEWEAKSMGAPVSVVKIVFMMVGKAYRFDSQPEYQQLC